MNYQLRKSVAFLLLVTMAGTAAFAQKRDHLTEKEADWIRDEQTIDRRIEVFIKAADRRLMLLVDPSAIQSKKEEEKWGPMPSGSVRELLEDYKRILDEAEEKLDDAFERLKKSDVIMKALSKFKDAAKRQLEQLRGLQSKVSNRKEEIALAEAIEEAETVTKGEVK